MQKSLLHKLHGSASTVLTATGQVNGRWQILTPHRIETHEPAATKIPHNWLHSREDPLNQIWYKSIHWGLLGIWVKYNIFVPFLFMYTFFFSDLHTGQTGWWIFTRDSWLDVKSCKDVPFRGYKILNPYLSPKTVKFWPKTHWTVFFAWKCLTMGALKSKLPLITIVAL